MSWHELDLFAIMSRLSLRKTPAMEEASRGELVTDTDMGAAVTAGIRGPEDGSVVLAGFSPPDNEDMCPNTVVSSPAKAVSGASKSASLASRNPERNPGTQDSGAGASTGSRRRSGAAQVSYKEPEPESEDSEDEDVPSGGFHESMLGCCSPGVEMGLDGTRCPRSHTLSDAPCLQRARRPWDPPPANPARAATLSPVRGSAWAVRIDTGCLGVRLGVGPTIYMSRIAASNMHTGCAWTSTHGAEWSCACWSMRYIRLPHARRG